MRGDPYGPEWSVQRAEAYRYLGLREPPVGSSSHAEVDDVIWAVYQKLLAIEARIDGRPGGTAREGPVLEDEVM